MQAHARRWRLKTRPLARAWALSALPKDAVEVGTDHVPSQRVPISGPPSYAISIACMTCMEGCLPGGTRPNTPHHHMGLWLQATVQMRLCRGCAQGGVWWKRVGGRAGARQGRTAQNSGRMFVFAATLVPRQQDIQHENVGERENLNPRNHRGTRTHGVHQADEAER